MKRAIVVLSGGLDSTVCMAVAEKEGCKIFPLTFDYGQRHSVEVEKAMKVAEFYGCGSRHLIVSTEFFKDIGHSALTANEIDVPVDRGLNQKDIPVTYVPFRNAVFLSMATGYAEAMQAEKIYIGVNALDYSGYPDCRPRFIAAFQEAVKQGTAAADRGLPIKIETPLLNFTKAQIVSLGVQNKAPLHLTTSCYQGGEKACGKCDSCKLRLKGFSEAGVEDPIAYEF